MIKVLLSLVLMMSFASASLFGADADSAKLFEAKCAKCHGKDGAGVEKMAKMLKVEKTKLDLTSGATAKAKDDDLIKVTNEGRKKMPKFKGKLKDSEIGGLVNYIRGLAPSKK